MHAPTCFMCGRLATSVEHAPPRCIFPELKDTKERKDYRRNLITVPACDEHNSQKSKDDEYLLFVLAASYTSSDVGLTQFTTKVRRAFERQRTKAEDFTRRSEPVLLRRVEQSEWEEGLQVIVQGHRLDAVLEHCAQALYFFQTGKKFLGPAAVLTNFTMYLDTAAQKNVTGAFEATEAYFATRPAHGENPDVFWYKYEESETTAIFLFCFYGESKAMVRFKKVLVSS